MKVLKVLFVALGGLSEEKALKSFCNEFGWPPNLPLQIDFRIVHLGEGITGDYTQWLPDLIVDMCGNLQGSADLLTSLYLYPELRSIEVCIISKLEERGDVYMRAMQKAEEVEQNGGDDDDEIELEIETDEDEEPIRHHSRHEMN